MKWTFNTPLIPGWYWRRDSKNSPVCIVELQTGRSGFLVEVAGNKLPGRCEWAGPIPAPQDQT